MAIKKGLGRGLGSLFGDETVDAVDSDAAARSAGVDASSGDGGLGYDPAVGGAEREASLTGEDGRAVAARMLRIIDVYPNPDQPRKTFDLEPLRSLAESIARHGVLQPIAVREAADGGYIIIAGERRWRASRIAGLAEIPAVITKVNDQVAAELALIENLQRVDLNAVEEAMGYKALSDSYGLTESEIGEMVGKSRSAVVNSLRLLGLEKPVLDMLRSGELSRGQARPLVTLEPTAQNTLAELIAKDGLSVRQVEKLVKKAEDIAAAPQDNRDQLELTAEPGKVVVDYFKDLSEHLSSRMSRRVKIVPGIGDGGRGWMHIEFYSDDDLNLLAGIIVNQNIDTPVEDIYG